MAYCAGVGDWCMVYGLLCRDLCMVDGLLCRYWCMVYGLLCREGVWFTVQGFGIRVIVQGSGSGLGFRVQWLGTRVYD